MNLSVVIPVYNEEENVIPLARAVDKVLGGLGGPSEIIFVDDGSTDRTFARLKDLQGEISRLRVIRLRGNFGQTAALAAGFDLAQGEVVVTLDGDLQNDPADIPAILAKLEEGFDVVSGWRRERQDPFWTRRLPSRLANALISRITGVRLHDYGCMLKAYRQPIVKDLALYGEMHRFLPALARWVGASVAEVPVSHHLRRHGRSKYGLGRTVRVFLDLFTVKFLMSYWTRPIQIFGLLGLLTAGVGLLLALILAAQRLFFGVPLGNRPILLFAALLVIVGIQFLTMGLLAEMLVRTYHESQGKPIYSIREVVGVRPEVGKEDR